MRRTFCFFVLILMSCIILPGIGKTSAASDPPRIILYTYYRQMGWGDRVQIGSVDEKGAIRILIGHDSGLKWPYKPEEQLEYVSQTEKFTVKETLKHDDLFSLKSLTYDVEDQGSKSVPAACDAGTEKSYAVRYSRDGEPEIILLGMSGDDFFENFDPNAQALYLRLRQMFPEVTSYAYGPMGPQGSAAIPLAEFAGLDVNAVLKAEIKGYLTDCEEGLIPLDLIAEDKTKLIYMIQNAVVTGKADCVLSTGGSYAFSFYDPEDNWIGAVELENGLLVMNDGRYYIEIR